MKSLAIFLLAFYATFLLLTTACSDNSHSTADVKVNEEKSDVRIRFNVAFSRAATADEEKISSVSLYVFDSNGRLESYEMNLSPADDAVSIEASSGKKTIYAISGRQLISPTPEMTLADFETTPFDYSPADIKADDTFAMIGSSTITVPNSAADTPTADCTITLTRLAAKVQVVCNPKLSSLKTSLTAIGIDSLEDAKFCVMQACTRTRAVPDGSDIFDFNNASNTAGTYDGFENATTFTAAPSKASPSSNVQYLPENIPSSPTSGNTSFVALKLQVNPSYVIQYDTWNDIYNECTFTFAQTLYLVGFYDKATGFAEYATRLNGDIFRFYVKDEAKAFFDKVKSGKKPLRLTSDPTGTPTTRDKSDLEIFEFTDGWVYYRINIEDTDADGNKRHQVVRNKFYTLNINSINKFGVPSLSHLFPSDPTTPLSSYQESSAL